MPDSLGDTGKSLPLRKTLLSVTDSVTESSMDAGMVSVVGNCTRNWQGKKANPVNKTNIRSAFWLSRKLGPYFMN